LFVLEQNPCTNLQGEDSLLTLLFYFLLLLRE